MARRETETERESTHVRDSYPTPTLRVRLCISCVVCRCCVDNQTINHFVDVEMGAHMFVTNTTAEPTTHTAGCWALCFTRSFLWCSVHVYAYVLCVLHSLKARFADELIYIYIFVYFSFVPTYPTPTECKQMMWITTFYGLFLWDLIAATAISLDIDSKSQVCIKTRPAFNEFCI